MYSSKCNNTKMHGEGRCTVLPVVLCTLLKKSSDDPYLKIIYFSPFFVADAHGNKQSKYFTKLNIYMRIWI